MKLIAVAAVILPFAGELSSTVGPVVTTVKFLVALVFVLLALSVHWTYQEWLPSDMPVIVKLAAVLLPTEELVRFRNVSRNMEQFIAGARLSVAVKLKETVDELTVDRLPGELRLMLGTVVSIVKVLVALVLLLLTASVQETLQLWAPWPVTEYPRVAGTLFVAVVELTGAPSMLRVHDAFADTELVSLKLKFNEVAEVLRPLIGELRTTAGAVVTTVKFQVALVLVLLAAFLHETFQ
jgi:hypothetical protein